ncbi:MAG: hypothetical protein K2Q24_09140 [Chitinophagaceae bacterium]|nr:hypothetical protein [Chitinophagaceae bacterium]
MRVFLLLICLLFSKGLISQTVTQQDTIYLFDFVQISSNQKSYTGRTVVYFNETDSLILKADRKRRMFDYVESYFEGVEVIVPSNQSPKKIKVRVWEKYNRIELYCDTLLTLKKTKKNPPAYYFYIEHRGWFKPQNPCSNLKVFNSDQSSRQIFKDLIAEFERFYLWQYDYKNNKLMKYLPY